MDCGVTLKRQKCPNLKVRDCKRPSRVEGFPEVFALYEAQGTESSAVLESKTGRESKLV